MHRSGSWQTGVLLQRARQRTHIALGAQNVLACFVVTGLGQREAMVSTVTSWMSFTSAVRRTSCPGSWFVLQKSVRLFEHELVHTPQHDGWVDRFADVVERTQLQKPIFSRPQSGFLAVRNTTGMWALAGWPGAGEGGVAAIHAGHPWITSSAGMRSGAGGGGNDPVPAPHGGHAHPVLVF